MLRSKIVKRALEQGFSSRSRRLLQILGLTSKIELIHLSYQESLFVDDENLFYRIEKSALLYFRYHDTPQ